MKNLYYHSYKDVYHEHRDTDGWGEYMSGVHLFSTLSFKGQWSPTKALSKHGYECFWALSHYVYNLRVYE